MSIWKRLFGGKDKPPPSNPSRPEKHVGQSSSETKKTDTSEKEVIPAGVVKSSLFAKNEKPHMQFQKERREVRVFISSTFRDMRKEREELVKKVFPQLRKLCAERFVTFSEVDLRWGITEKQKDEGKVLPLCLAEIERCKPYFIGVLGERYGWLPKEEAFTEKLLSDQPWLKEHREGASVTELEIIHGVLGSHAMRDRAFFYFRAKEKSIKIEEELKNDKDYQPEPEDSSANLERLKKRIKESGHPVYENYPDAETFGQMALKHLTDAIDTLYPANETLAEISREAAAQESYAIGKRLAYVKRPGHIAVLDQYADEDPHGVGLVLTGESGCGKTALLADWVEKRCINYQEEFLIQHYLGATSESASALGCVRRLLGELKDKYGLTEEIPSDPDKLREALALWLAQTTGKGKLIIILDGLNQIEGEERDRRLEWLPRFVPSHVRLISSALPGPALDELQRRNWQTHEIPLAGLPERKEMINAFLQIYRKTLREDLVAQLAEAPGSANPLYLRTALEELRIYGSHEELPAYLTQLIEAGTPAELFGLVIQRWMKDYGPDRALAAKALKLLWAARQGLSEHEWKELIEEDGTALLRLDWTPLFLAMEPHLNQRVGLYAFGHAYFREAVEAELVPTEGARQLAHLMIAEYFEKQPVGHRKAVELPWQLKEAGQKERLTQQLLNIPLFLLVRTRDQNELMAYWAWLGQERTMGRPYLQAFEQWAADKGESADVSIVANQLGFFLNAAALHTEAEPLMRRALAINEKSFGNDHPRVAIDLNNLAQLLKDTNRLAETEPLMRRSLAINEKSLGEYHPNVATSLNNLAQLLKDTNRLAEAEPLMCRVITICEKSLGENHPNVATSLNNLAQLLKDTNRLAEAEPILLRALSIDVQSYGNDHPSVAGSLNNLAHLLQATNRLAEADPVMRRVITIFEKSLGQNHPSVAGSLNNLASLLQATNRLTEAEPLMRRALSIYEQSYGNDHPSVATSLNNLAQLLHATNRLAEAEPLMRRVIAIFEKSLGENHPNVATSLNNLAQLLKDTNRLVEAEPLMCRALSIYEQSYGNDHPSVATSLNNLARLLQAANRLTEAELLMRRMVEIFLKFTRATGHPHPHLQAAANNYAALLQAMGRSQEEIMATLRKMAPEFF